MLKVKCLALCLTYSKPSINGILFTVVIIVVTLPDRQKKREGKSILPFC